MKDIDQEIPNQCINIGLYWDKLSFRRFRENLLNRRTQNLASEIYSNISKILNNNDLRRAIGHLNEQRNRLVNKLRGNILFDEKLQLRGKLLLGSGLPSVLEVGMTFSRNYGLPVIPGSALKGCFSHYCKEKNKKGKIFSDEEFKIIFGEDVPSRSENVCGNVLFLDAFPSEKIGFGLDIVNNHFPRYYTKGEIPNDWYNPIPVTYIVVTEGMFRFTLIAIENIDQTLREKLKKEFENMLTSYGIGAKTNYAYGRFGR